MRALIQRVSFANVSIDGSEFSRIDDGLVVFLGIGVDDKIEDVQYLIQKIVGLRIFSDAEGKMNWALDQVKGEILLISQFTLFASTKKGKRPSYIEAAPPAQAETLYNAAVYGFKEHLADRVKTGRFGADMKVNLINEGPVTIWIDSRLKN